MLLSCNNKKTVGWFTGSADISPALSQPVTASLWYGRQALCQPNAVLLHTGSVSDINAASKVVENYSHLLMTAVKTKKNQSCLTQVENALLPNYEGCKSR